MEKTNIWRLGTMVPRKDKLGALARGMFLRDQGFSAQIKLSIAPQEHQQLIVRIYRKLEKPFPVLIKLFESNFWEAQTAPGLRPFAQGIFQGMIWALILYHFLFFIGVRDITYLYYCLYMVCISLLTLGDFGYWQKHIWPNSPFLGWAFFEILQYITGIMTYVFMQSFVQLHRILPKWDKVITRFIWANVGVLLLIIIAYLFTRDDRIVLWGKILIIPFATLGILFCYLLIRSRDTVAIYFALAGGMLAVAIAINAILEIQHQQSNPIDTNYTRFYIIQIAAIAHLMTFAFGMSYRRRQKDIVTQRTLEMEELRSRLYTNITHEFRTPLTVIRGMADNITGHEKEKSLIERNTNNLLRLINQLLDLSKLEKGGLKLHLEQADIVSFLQYLAEAFHSLAEEKQLKLAFYSEQDNILMDFDREKIQQIIYNLLSNAIKFTPTGGQVVLHSRREKDQGQEFLYIKIKDTGIGIPETDLPNIFDRFYQVDNTHSRAGEGTGIGLALTKELVQLMNGNIKVTSQTNEGTTFSIQIPITRNAEYTTHENKIKPIDKALPPSLDLPIQQAKVLPEKVVEDDKLPILLIIEDNADVAEYIKSILDNQYRLLHAQDGQEGIELAIEQIPDLIVSDVMMPKKDGFEVCQMLKQDERTSHIPIVLLTAKATETAKLEGLRYGADAYLTKPFNQEELRLRLRNLKHLSEQLQARYLHSTDGEQEVSTEDKMSDLEQQFLDKLKQVVMKHLGDATFSVPDLAKTVAMSQMQIYRKLKALTKQTPSQFIRRIRLLEGKKLLQQGELNVSEIAYEVGFTDPNYFSRTFHKEFGVSPSQVKKR